MPAPDPTELVFPMTNNIKTDVRFKMKNKHNRAVRTFAAILPRSRLRRKLRAKEVVRRADPSGWEGICCALSCMYLMKSHELGNVTQRDQVDGNTFKLTIAQAAYEKDPSADGKDIQAMLGVFGLKSVDDHREETVQDLVDHVPDNPGRYLAHVFYDGGNSHFIALRSIGGAYFIFEPEEGLYRFDTYGRFTNALGCHLADDGLEADSPCHFWETALD